FAPTGRYVLTVELRAISDDVGDTTADAVPLTFSAQGTATFQAAIGTPGDIDVFSFVAPVTGPFTVYQNAAPGSFLDSVLTVFDDTGNEIAFNDDSGGTRDSTVTLTVEAGRTYYAQAAGFEDSTGDYALLISPAADDVGDTFDTAA